MLYRGAILSVLSGRKWAHRANGKMNTIYARMREARRCLRSEQIREETKRLKKKKKKKKKKNMDNE